jgi:hypothetical protein
MPWKECSAVEERLRFGARLLEAEAMTDIWARILGRALRAWRRTQCLQLHPLPGLLCVLHRCLIQ